METFDWLTQMRCQSEASPKFTAGQKILENPGKKKPREIKSISRNDVVNKNQSLLLENGKYQKKKNSVKLTLFI